MPAPRGRGNATPTVLDTLHAAAPKREVNSCIPVSLYYRSASNLQRQVHLLSALSLFQSADSHTSPAPISVNILFTIFFDPMRAFKLNSFPSLLFSSNPHAG